MLFGVGGSGSDGKVLSVSSRKATATGGNNSQVEAIRVRHDDEGSDGEVATENSGEE